MKSGDIMDLFKFTWHAIRDPDTFTTVFTHNKEHMTLFLQQHGFDPNSPNVEVVDDTCYEYKNSIKNDVSYIKLFKMGSRKRDMIYQIATTDEIINEVTTAIADELCTCMQFGACALRGEIEIFDRISKLIGELDYVYITDEIDFESEYGEDVDMYRYQGYPYYEEIAMDASVDRLYTDLSDDCTKGDSQLLPYTIESYVTIFTNLFLMGEEPKQLKEPRLPDLKEMHRNNKGGFEPWQK